MTIADITLAIFTLCNSVRILAYVPQITKAVTDQSGAKAISFGTWGLFLISNISAVAYALVNKDDWTLALMFLANAIGCTAIIGVGRGSATVYPRARDGATASTPSKYLTEEIGDGHDRR